MEIDPKLLFGITASLISAYVLGNYLISALKEKIRPHPYSWLIWSMAATTAFFGQLEGNAGYSLIFTGWIALGCGIIALTGFIKFKAVIKKIDLAFLIGAVCALIILPFSSTALYSLIIVCMIDAIGHIPTIRKSWNDPYGEKASAFALFMLTNTLSIMAINSYNFMSVAFPTTIFTCSFIVVSVLLLRRYIYKPASV